MGMMLSSVTGGGDCRTLDGTDEAIVEAMPFKSSDVPWGVSGPCWMAGGAEGVRRCFRRYEADRGSGSEGLVLVWSDERRLTFGEVEVEEAGDRLGGV
jgi:hypothetical protein